MSEVTVILRQEACRDIQAQTAQLKAMGMEISDVDEDLGVIEGTIASDKLGAIAQLPWVETARCDFTYIAEDPRQTGG
jgi:hypothetical protein